MSDSNVESYKKSVAKFVDAWGKQVENLAKQVEDLKKEREAVQTQLDKASYDLSLKLSKMDALEADKKEIAKVPAWLDDLITKKGSPLTKGGLVDLAPGAGFDDKAKKLTVSMGVSWDW